METEEEFAAYRERMAIEASGRPILHCIDHFEHPDNQWRAIFNTRTNKWFGSKGKWTDDIYEAHRFTMKTYHHTAKEEAELWLNTMKFDLDLDIEVPGLDFEDGKFLEIRILTLGVQ